MKTLHALWALGCALCMVPAASAQIIDCACDSAYVVGDRVELLVDNPSGALNLPAGTQGTVLCGDEGDWDLYISWDDYSQGHNNASICECQSGDDVEDNSHRLVLCGEVAMHVDGSPYTVDDDGPADFHTIQDALDVAVAGEEVIVYPGTYTESNGQFEVVEMYEAVYLHSSDGPGSTIIDGEFLRPGIGVVGTDNTAETAIIEGFTIFQGIPSGTRGGGMHIYDCGPTEIRNCIFESCDASNGSNTGKGGAVFIETSNGDLVLFDNCEFNNNTCEECEGGAVYVEALPNGAFQDCLFYHNESRFGGAVFFSANFSNTHFIGCNFSQNSAGDGPGGAVKIGGNDGSFLQCDFQGNSAYSGGALYIDTDISVRECHFQNNSVDGSGGAVFLSNTYSSFYDTSFINNSALTWGGAYYGGGAYPFFDTCIFDSNIAPIGGAHYILGGNSTCNTCVFAGNIAYQTASGFDGKGGAIYVGQWGSLGIDSSSITQNSAVDDYNVASDTSCGGGIYCDSDTSLDMANTIVSMNYASTGGGLDLYYSEVQIDGCQVESNVSSDGGGFSVVFGELSCTDSNISGNSARRGGGMYCSQVDPVLSGCTISGNAANYYQEPDTGRGGGMFNYRSSPLLINTELSGNMAETWGGAMCNDTLSFPDLDGCTVSDNTAKITGGGMYSAESTVWSSNTAYCGNSPNHYFGGFMDIEGNTFSDQCEPPALCLGDTNIDYNVDVLDLLYVIAVWNTENPAGDINEDGRVDILDLLAVLSNWGQCNSD